MSIITVTFQNAKARFAVQMKVQDAIDMINDTPMLAGMLQDSKGGPTICLAEEIFKELGIIQHENTAPLISVYSFDHWDSLQDPEKVIVWGNTTADKPAEVFDHAVPYKNVPGEIKRMFYTQYVHEATNPSQP